jgi:hypothetical protein
MPVRNDEKTKTIRLTPPQIELLTDIATRPQMYYSTYSRWAKTGAVLVRHGLADESYVGAGSTEIVITQAGRDEAARRGIGVTRPQPVVELTPHWYVSGPNRRCAAAGCGKAPHAKLHRTSEVLALADTAPNGSDGGDVR